MFDRARPQYFDVVRAVHDANQQSNTNEKRQNDHSRKVLVVEKIFSEKFHCIVNNHFNNQIIDFFNSNQRV